MRPVIVTGVTRADLAVVDQLAELGVATVHEAIGRAGYLGPGLRPIQDGTRTGGTAVTASVTDSASSTRLGGQPPEFVHVDDPLVQLDEIAVRPPGDGPG